MKETKFKNSSLNMKPEKKEWKYDKSYQLINDLVWLMFAFNKLFLINKLSLKTYK